MNRLQIIHFLHKTGATIGRFQPFNLGHKYMVDMLLALCERVCVIISDDTVIDKRNPFPKELIAEMIKEIYKDEVAEGRLVIGYKVSEHISDDAWGAYLLNVFYQNLGSTPEFILHGDEQCRRGWFNEQQREHTTETFVANHPIANGHILEFRSTMVREALANDNFEAFKELVDPKIHHYYDTLRKYVNEAEDK